MSIFITDCCGCNSIPVKQYPTLAKIYIEDPLVNYYQAFCNVGDLIEACLLTPDGLVSSDKRLYRRGKDLMVKLDRESTVCYHRVATLIIDEYQVINDFDPIERDIYNDLHQSKWSCEELKLLAEQLESAKEII